MLKKIEVGQLRVGMYIHELCSSWIDTPFWQKSFMLNEIEELKKIQNTKIREAWIDTVKGLDVLPKAGNAPAQAIPATATSTSVQRQVTVVSMDEELGRASMIVNKSKQAVYSMFNEARMGKAVDVENAQVLVEEIAESVMRNPGALIGLARLKTKDDYTYMHSVAVCALMVALGKQLGLDEEQMREAGLAGLLHDIGKMAIPGDILNKPGKLTDEEFVSVKTHPAAGHKMLLEAKGVSNITLDVCLHHHEKMDGSGYPERLQGDEISMYARMGAVCDVYDAITSNRPYKQGWCPAESLRKMAEWSNGHFDEKIFQAFVKSIGIYPVGTLVRLESGRLGVVIEQQTGKSLLLPKVRVFFSTKSMGYIAPELLDLAGPGLQDKIIAREDAVNWGLKDIGRYWLGDIAPSN
ncbi:MAG: HD-GYP domain-containing protein [Burkholderiales bacterium]|nr:HD-GYP domain-containing protein [Burkholderiales bacterium]